VAAVVGGTGGGRVGEGVGRDEVAPPDLDRIETKLVGHQVDGPLAHGGRLGASRAAVGTGGGGVGEDDGRADLDVGEPVGARSHALGDEGDEHTPGAVGPGVGHDPHPDPDDGAVATGADLELVDRRPSVGHAGEVLAAGLVPPHRPLETVGEGGDDHLLGVHAPFRPEAAADGRRPHPHVRLVEAEGVADVVAHPEHRLGAHPHLDGVGAVGLGHHPVVLHGHRRHPVVAQFGAHHHVGLGEGVGVALGRQVEHHVGPVLGEQQRGVVAQRVEDVDHRGQGVDLDDHPFGGVHRRGQRLGNDHRDRLADIPDPFGGQQGPGELGLTTEGAGRRQVEIGTGHHAHHPGRRFGLGGVDGGEQVPWATVERTKTAWRCPVGSRSARNGVSPVSRPGSSRRSMLWPRIVVPLMATTLGAGRCLRSGPGDGASVA
jgi:hypothetical protein